MKLCSPSYTKLNLASIANSNQASSKYDVHNEHDYLLI